MLANMGRCKNNSFEVTKLQRVIVNNAMYSDSGIELFKTSGVDKSCMCVRDVLVKLKFQSHRT